MKKYRIKQEVYKDGNVKYYPQYYRGVFSSWKSLHRDGEKCLHTDNLNVSSRELALSAIDLCEKGKNIVISVKYEYLDK